MYSYVSLGKHYVVTVIRLALDMSEPVLPHVLVACLEILYEHLLQICKYLPSCHILYFDNQLVLLTYFIYFKVGRDWQWAGFPLRRGIFSFWIFSNWFIKRGRSLCRASHIKSQQSLSFAWKKNISEKRDYGAQQNNRIKTQSIESKFV